MYKVRKRDGKIVSFDIEKIKLAIIKAFESEDEKYDENVIDFLSLKVTADFSEKIDDNIIDVEEIQDSVENVLSKAGYTNIAKAYILY
ncbi:ribonucleoside triphosphate reductase, partial [bacterium]|nr:ribonucleoside triphosphate reductase [bacterium]